MPVKDLADIHSAPHPKALGVEWDVHDDVMSTSLTLPTVHQTRCYLGHRKDFRCIRVDCPFYNSDESALPTPLGAKTSLG